MYVIRQWKPRPRHARSLSEVTYSLLMRATLLLLSTLFAGCPTLISEPEPEPSTQESPTPAPREWVAEAELSSPLYSLPVLAGDLSGDGTPNIVASYGPNKGERTVLASPLTSPPSPLAWLDDAPFGQLPAPIVGDLNGDGADDLVLHDLPEGTLSAWFGPVSGALGSPDWRFVGESASFPGVSAVIADLDGDGANDLLLSASGGPEEACSVSHHGTLLFRGPIAAGVLGPEDADTVFIEPAELDDCDGWFVDVFDANGDATLDVLIGSRNGHAHAYFGPIPDGTLDRSAADVFFGDPGADTLFWHDGVGTPDGILFGYGQTGVVALGMAFVPGPFAAGTITPADSASIWITPTEFFSPVFVAAADWDGDGVMDAAVTPRYGSEVTVVTGPLADARASVSARIPLTEGQGVLFAADVDGDGRTELVTGDSVAGLQVWSIRELEP